MPPGLAHRPPRETAERRQVTVMFSDLVGSTALSAWMDPEDLREVISAYQKCVAEAVQRLGGFVAKYMGDGVLVYFGYPRAHEDDAERAVRAGLELVEAGRSSRPPPSTANPRRHCHRAGRHRRLDRVGRGAGAGRRRRDTQPRGAHAGDCRTEHGRHRREHTKTARQSVRVGRPRAKDLKGIAAVRGLGGGAAKLGGEPFRGVARRAHCSLAATRRWSC